LDDKDIAHHLEKDISSSSGRGRTGENGQGLLTHLRNRWTIEELGKDRTRVSLELEYAFLNPLYATLSAGVASKVADMMANAYEERVKELLARDPEMAKAGLGELDGSGLKR
jgi:coenzyme Q-binding protein COQ10